MPVLKLTPRVVNDATVDALSALLEDAKAGKLLGLAYVALLDQDRYTADLIGSVNDHKLLARGLCAALEDTLR